MVAREGWRSLRPPRPGPPSTAHALVRITEMYLRGVALLVDLRPTSPVQLLLRPLAYLETLDDPDHPKPVGLPLLPGQPLHVVGQEVHPRQLLRWRQQQPQQHYHLGKGYHLIITRSSASHHLLTP